MVLVTKDRCKALTRQMLDRFRELGIPGKIILCQGNPSAEARCEGWGGQLKEVNGEPDHVHLLVSLPPNVELGPPV